MKAATPVKFDDAGTVWVVAYWKRGVRYWLPQVEVGEPCPVGLEVL